MDFQFLLFMLPNPLSDELASSFAAPEPTSAVSSRSTKLPRPLVACLPLPSLQEHQGTRWEEGYQRTGFT